MGLHRNPRAEEDLILDDKLDLTRTLVRWEARQTVRRRLNDLEPRLVEAHSKELASGKVTKLELNPGLLVGAEDNGDSKSS